MRLAIASLCGLLASLVGLLAATPLVLTVIYAVIDPPSLAILRSERMHQPAVQIWRPLDDMSPYLVRAVVMSEDARFCLHWGVDLGQMRIVVAKALDGQTPRGASTITMQVVKNLFLWPDRSYVRKALEVPLAFWMDLVLSKDRVLEIYLNIAQWGSNVFGAEAAAERYFGVASADLTREQALAMATMLPAPSVRHPLSPSRRHRAVMAHVEKELDRAPWVFTCLPERIRP